ncbi:MAG: NAD-dependent epimerase/dehydratase family protein [Pseudomonadota bacterium]
MARILVTGAAGFLGRHLTATLAARGDRVTALDLDPLDAAEGVVPVIGDVTDAGALKRHAEGHDAILHAAAIADLWAPGDTHDRVNRGGTEAAVAAAEETGAKLVYVSSYTTLVAVGTKPGARLDERVAQPPEALLGPYPTAKRRGEMAVEAAASRGLHALSVLPSAPIGAGDLRPTPPGRMTLDLARGATPALIDTVLDLVDVSALTTGILAALDRGIPGRRYLLTGEQLSLADFAGKVAALTGTPAPRARVPLAVALAAARVEASLAALTGRAPTAPLTGVRLAARPVSFDTTLAAQELGWAPPPIDAALAAAIQDFRERGLL